jgi:uncharacterized protein
LNKTYFNSFKGNWVKLTPMYDLLNNIWAVYLDTAFWLLLGLLAAGLVKTYIPQDLMTRWLGGHGFSAVGRAALFGAPLPLCSCGVLPAAMGLHRSGASKEATVSFLISTPETSIDSVAVTYALMGPVMAVYRPIAALMSAVVTGIMVSFVGDQVIEKKQLVTESCSSESSCCSNSEETESSCCGSEESGQTNRFFQAMTYAGADLLDDISKWLFIGIVVAGIMITVIPPGWLAQWGSGLPAMLVMLAIGVPMYICAVASTPIAAGLILAGVSPGTVLVFLLVGPATNIAGIILVRKELGTKVTGIYLLGLSIVSVSMGLLLDWLVLNNGFRVDVDMSSTDYMLPEMLSWASALLLLLLAVPKVRKPIFHI